MSKKPYIYPYKMSSKSATMLARALGTIKVYPDRDFRVRQDKLVINWGNSSFPDTWDDDNMLNYPNAVDTASNKLYTFEALRNSGILTPPWTVDKCEAKGMLLYGGLLYVRHLICSSGGNGISVLTDRNAVVPDAPLYTGGIPCKREYRVHVFDGEVIDVVAKMRPNGGDTDTSDYIRNHTMGYVFGRDTIPNIPWEVLERLKEVAIESIHALDLDFGAIDIIRGMDNSLSVLEVNTAPGIEGTTLDAYVTAIRKYCED